MKTSRRFIQAGFVALTLVGVFLFRANAESWCPFGGVEAIYTYAVEGNLLCSLGISNFYVLVAVVLTVLLLRRAFCGYLCPIGAISDWLGILGNRCGSRSKQVPAKLDRVLSLGKYAILVIILAATWQASELVFRGYCPAYALLGRHGADITFWAYVVAGAIALGSLVVAMPFCRWFCPLAAVLNPISRFGFGRIKRDESVCTRCGRCSVSCPMAIPVDELSQVTASRCLSCMNCVDACPHKKERALVWGPPNRFGQAWPQAAVIMILLLCGSAAVATAYLAPLPSFVKQSGQPPRSIATVDLRIQGLTCRGRANLLVGFLERDDLYRIQNTEENASGFYRLEAWPDPIMASVRISYDSEFTDGDAVKRAIVEPYYDMATDRWWQSPFVIEGYAPPGLE